MPDPTLLQNPDGTTHLCAIATDNDSTSPLPVDFVDFPVDGRPTEEKS